MIGCAKSSLKAQRKFPTPRVRAAALPPRHNGKHYQALLNKQTPWVRGIRASVGTMPAHLMTHMYLWNSANRRTARNARFDCRTRPSAALGFRDTHAYNLREIAIESLYVVVGHRNPACLAEHLWGTTVTRDEVKKTFTKTPQYSQNSSDFASLRLYH